jgi:hypothetical protein
MDFSATYRVGNLPIRPFSTLFVCPHSSLIMMLCTANGGAVTFGGIIMGHTLRAVVGATLAGTVTFAGLAIAGPASAATAAPSPTPSSVASTSTCRYTVDANKPVPVKSGPGKKYTTQGWVSPDRERPIFGTCAEPGTGPSHWVKVSQGKFKGGWIWRNWLDRM